MARVVILLQARMGSQRLPGKSLAPIADESLLSIVLRRLLASRTGPVVLATTTAADDDRLAREAARFGVPTVHGSPDDVLGRFVAALAGRAADIVIRATADNPAVDIEAAGRAVAALEESGADYCHEHGLPYGAVVEAVRVPVLLDAAARATSAADREHVTTFIRQRGNEYRLVEPHAPAALRRPDLRLSVDTANDLAFMRAIAAALPQPLASAPLTEIIAAADRVRDGAAS